MTADAEIFDRGLRRLRRDRAAPDFADHAFLLDHLIDELMHRLDSVTRTFSKALVLGCFDGRLAEALRARGLSVVSADAGWRFAHEAGGVQCDEDRLPFADGSFDLVVSAGVLDSVNDLPGALTLIRRILKPDGLFLGGFVGAGSLPRLRTATLAADSVAGGGVAARIHPQIDIRAAGDLLSRAGFALPVADGDRLDVGYANPFRLIADLRGMAGGNLLRGERPAFGRAGVAALAESFADAADPDGRTRERFELVYLIGWAPAPDQPRPARRGSAVRSLADALKPPSAS
ncbi:SAM-dependent methyltransferase [Sphingomonas oleivorans]|uniref:SAM-dependent methyltransferase n=1 Tax=Sphingomonas oleivorans TaxID=1735121 RepID=A0A2T5FYM4_9SPHN|nr:class I SAM-dependent methyltransferase [Sphingomonas oleivorans]PTQ11640.1 SAM-dependent methyltransferase [Sphingomonas oleivorans]